MEKIDVSSQVRRKKEYLDSVGIRWSTEEWCGYIEGLNDINDIISKEVKNELR